MMIRNLRLLVISAAGTSLLAAAGVRADATSETTQRNVNQQERIEQGLKSGQLNTKEAGKLERDESRINRMESSALKDGSMSPAEAARINKAENKASKDIYQESMTRRQATRVPPRRSACRPTCSATPTSRPASRPARSPAS